ncbi:hypothetical protein ABWH97_13945 [Nitratireductor sp. ac15]
MSDEAKLNEYRYLANNETLKDMFDEIEQKSFERFMGRKWFLRFRRQGQGDIARIEAIREIRSELNLRARHSGRNVKPVV